jgi:hypothetical protein
MARGPIQVRDFGSNENVEDGYKGTDRVIRFSFVGEK